MKKKVSREVPFGPIADTLLKRIDDRTARIGIIGQGYVGLPLAMAMADVGFHVVGFDIDAAKVRALNEGRSYIGDVADEEIRRHAATGRYQATTDFAGLASCDCVSICVPTPLSKTRDPDMSFIDSAARNVLKYIRKGQLIALESTTYPGTTEDAVLPIFEGTGLVCGEDYFLCFSPERVDPGNPNFDSKNTPRLVGGTTTACTKLGVAMYGSFLTKVVAMSSTQAAEMAKLLENTFRAVNIGLVNEVAIMCKKLGLDTWEVIDGAATKPFGFMKFTPGPGLGGHCIPVDPLYLSWILRSHNYTARFIELAAEINTSMPSRVVELVAEALNDDGKPLKGMQVLVLGIAYKGNVADVRESPALDVIELLKGRGAIVSYHDPYVPSYRLGAHFQDEEVHGIDLTDEVLANADAVVVTTDHRVVDWRRVTEHTHLIIDTRNATKGLPPAMARIVRL